MKNIMKKAGLFAIVAVFCIVVFGVSNSKAGPLPYAIGTVESFLIGTENTTHSYFNGYQVVTDKNFSGLWQYTAIAFEAGHRNITNEGGSVTFSTQVLGNWGSWDYVNFTNSNIYFSDMGDAGPRNVPLDPFITTTTQFKLFQLTADSDMLTYLGVNKLILSKGTYIVGWKDATVNLVNGLPPAISSSLDYDDIIIALHKVPEPTTMLLLGFGLFGLAGISRKLKK